VMAPLPSSLSISQPAVTYLTWRARRREIKSRETLIALANVTGREVADKTHNVHAARGRMFQRQCGAYGVKSSTGSSVTLNASHVEYQK